jgi:hypothetical protein
VTTAALPLNAGTSTNCKNGFYLGNLSASTASLFYGAAGVTTSTGKEIPAGQTRPIPMADVSQTFVIAVAGGTATADWDGYN